MLPLTPFITDFILAQHFGITLYIIFVSKYVGTGTLHIYASVHYEQSDQFLPNPNSNQNLSGPTWLIFFPTLARFSTYNYVVS